MNFKFIYPNTPNAMILSSILFIKSPHKPQVFKQLLTANLIVLVMKFFKTEIIRLTNPFKAAVINLSRLFIPTTVIKKITITAVF